MNGMTDRHLLPGVRGYVAERKPKVRAEADRGPVTVLLPQTHRPGEEGEVDSGEVVNNLRGESVNCMLLSLRLSFSGKAVHRIFLRTDSEMAMPLEEFLDEVMSLLEADG